MRRRPHLKEIYGSVRPRRLQQWNYNHKQMFAREQAAHRQVTGRGRTTLPSALWPGVHEPSVLSSFDMDGIDAVSVTIGSEPRTVHQLDVAPPVYFIRNGYWTRWRPT